MPYYRIVIWTKKRKAPYSGIRLYSDTNINSVYNWALAEAKKTYQETFLDVEVQMLSKLCKAVIEHEKKPK